LTALIWVISVPIILYIIALTFRDNLRYALIPCMIANLVFIFMTSVLSFVVVGFGLIRGSSTMVKAMHTANLSVLALTIISVAYYDRRFSSKDLLRTDEEEIEA
jgi:hypothetical protein